MRRYVAVALSCLVVLACRAASAAGPAVDISEVAPGGPIGVQQRGDQLRLIWPLENGEAGEVVLDLREKMPLFRSIGMVPAKSDQARVLIERADPVTYLLVGSRQSPPDRPPGMSVFNVFFDSPANRSFQSFRSTSRLEKVRAVTHGRRATITLGPVEIGPSFAGVLEIHVYEGSPLLHIETVVHTSEKDRAILYDSGLEFAGEKVPKFSWVDTEGVRREAAPDSEAKDRAIAVRHRSVVASSEAGSVVAFPPPHQYFFPRDFTDNLATVWYGANHRGLGGRFGFGIRQAERGGGNYSPWFNAPPGTEQRLGVFYLLSTGDAPQALEQTLRFTHHDRFSKLDGYRTFTSHWHMAIAMAAMAEKTADVKRPKPDFVAMFKDMGIDIVHLAEFHGDGHPQGPDTLRLAELDALFEECRRLSDRRILFLPGEEANNYLGTARPGREVGHWIYLFTRPVFWTMTRHPGQPFLDRDTRFGEIYHVGSGADMAQLLDREHGLAWTTHPRIKASNWTPDIFRKSAFFRSDHWLGAAWKAMPADLSNEQLGKRGLDLLDDMANWGGKKYLPGEVDVFKVDHTHELFAHMNVNYLRLEPDRLPRFHESWQPILDALRGGRFFVSTGEVLMPGFTVDGKSSGQTLELDSAHPPELRVELEWTFPLSSVVVVSGDGGRVNRRRFDQSGTVAFGKAAFPLAVDLAGQRWVRVEAWDIAGNGAFSQPVWIESKHR
jgi:hypothetical protein